MNDNVVVVQHSFKKSRCKKCGASLGTDRSNSRTMLCRSCAAAEGWKRYNQKHHRYGFGFCWIHGKWKRRYNSEPCPKCHRPYEDEEMRYVDDSLDNDVAVVLTKMEKEQ